MQIQFITEGGIAYFPGLSKPRIINTENLSPEENNQIKELVNQSGFFNLTQHPTTPQKGADRKKYTISIVDGNKQNSIVLYDPIGNQALANLIHLLSRLTKK
jgi:hypothetical protein